MPSEKTTAEVGLPSRFADRKRTARAQSWRKDRGSRANKKWMEIHRRYELLRPHLDERARRCWAGAEAAAYGRGGIAIVAEATGLSTHTVTAGLREVRESPPALTTGAVRRAGAGRKPLKDSNPHLVAALEALAQPKADGAPLLRWTRKSLRALSRELRERGHHAGPDVVGNLLRELGYRLRQSPRIIRTKEHPDPSLQLEQIVKTAERFLEAGQPVISVDVRIRRSDEPDHGSAVPNTGGDRERAAATWLGTHADGDSVRFAVETIRLWWAQMGHASYSQAPQLLITLDAAGAIESEARLWKAQLQTFADESGLRINVCRFPPTTRKWNQIEHHMLGRSTLDWGNRVLIDREVTVSLVVNGSVGSRDRAVTTPRDPARVGRVPRGWNYMIRPHPISL